jgi:formate dehydrogenase subunit gamma
MQINQPLIFHKNHTPLVKKVLAEHQSKEGNLLPILHGIQDELGYIPNSVITPLAEALNLSAAEIHGVISFYTHFKTAAPSKVVIEICQAEACHSMGAVNLKKELINYLEQSGHDVSVENVYCLGLCAQSPAIMINNKPLAKVTLDKLKASIEGELA